MFLKNLKIYTEEEVIRDITFHKGLNLIVDETESHEQNDSETTETGNSVGKTTVLRLVDYCLGGKGENIYKDPESKGKTDIFQFLTNKKVLISLVLKEDLEIPNSKELIIRRNFLKYKEKIQEINGKYYNNVEFPQTLQKEIFKKTVEKPTFRQIVAKNIRYEKKALENTLYVLHDSTGDAAYEAIFLFLFGLDSEMSQKKQQLIESQNFEIKLKNRLSNESSESHMKQSLKIINRDLQELEIQKQSFSDSQSYGSDIKQLNDYKSLRNQVTTRIENLKFRQSLILESKAELEKDSFNADQQNLKHLYQESKSLLPNIQKSFEDLVAFHNKMLAEKISYITKELPELEKTLSALNSELLDLNSKIATISQKLKNSNLEVDLTKTVNELNKRHEQKGQYEERLRQIETNKKSLDHINIQLDEINQKIESIKDDWETQLEDFNEFFSNLSKRIYNEEYVVSLGRNSKAYKLHVNPVSGNPGTGKKKVQIAAFDFAYIQFCESKNIPCLHFILHDQLETIHNNQLTTISNIANESNSQYIFPILKDKLPNNFPVSKYQIISLSEEEKLFKQP